MTLISVGLKVLYPMVRMVVRGRIDSHRPAAQHLIGLFFLVFSILGFSIFFLLFALHPSSPLSSPLLFPMSFLASVAHKTDFVCGV